MSALSYMQRRASGTYEFRRPLPRSLAGRSVPEPVRRAFPDLLNAKTGCFKRELVRSLKTKDVKEAKRLNHQEASRVARLFDEAELALTRGPTPSSNVTEAELCEISSEVLAELLQGDEAERNEGDDRRRLQNAADRAQWPDLEPVAPLAPNASASPAPQSKGMTKDHHAAYGVLLGELEDEFREAYARRDPAIVHAETRVALKRRGMSLDPSAPHHRQVGMAVLEGTVRAYDLMRRRQAGEVVSPLLPLHRTSFGPQESLQDRGPKLSDAFATWKAGGAAKGAKKPNANTIVEAEQAVRYFVELHGDMRLGDVTREKARQYRDAVARVPTNLPGKLRRLVIPELLKGDLTQYRQRSATTVHKLLALVGAVISQAEREGRLDAVQGFINPFGRGIRFAIEERDQDRAVFAKSDLEAIFRSPVYTDGDRPLGGGGEAAFWLPLIALFSGMRLDEVAQLRLCDLQLDEETGRWLFDISRSGGRSVKTRSSIRRVPMHPELQKIGLLRYRESLIDRGAAIEGPLWPDVRASGARTRSSAWSKWFGRHLRERCDIKDTNKVFHSFRHTFKRMSRDAGLSEEVHDALTGHSGGQSVGRSYGQGFSAASLVKAIDQIKPPVDLQHLRWKQV